MYCSQRKCANNDHVCARAPLSNRDWHRATPSQFSLLRERSNANYTSSVVVSSDGSALETNALILRSKHWG